MLEIHFLQLPIFSPVKSREFPALPTRFFGFVGVQDYRKRKCRTECERKCNRLILAPRKLPITRRPMACGLSNPSPWTGDPGLDNQNPVRLIR